LIQQLLRLITKHGGILTLKKALLSITLVLAIIMSVFPVNAYADGAKNPDRNKSDVSSHKPKDHGPEPYTLNIAELASLNKNFREAVWTGDLLQLIVMSIEPEGEIGLEEHSDTDHFFYVVEGTGLVEMGEKDTNVHYSKPIEPGSGIFVPKGEWHNIINKGSKPLKILVIYAPPHHEHGTVHKTKAEAEK